MLGRDDDLEDTVAVEVSDGGTRVHAASRRERPPALAGRIRADGNDIRRITPVAGRIDGGDVIVIQGVLGQSVIGAERGAAQHAVAHALVGAGQTPGAVDRVASEILVGDGRPVERDRCPLHSCPDAVRSRGTKEVQMGRPDPPVAVGELQQKELFRVGTDNELETRGTGSCLPGGHVSPHVRAVHDRHAARGRGQRPGDGIRIAGSIVHDLKRQAYRLPRFRRPVAVPGRVVDLEEKPARIGSVDADGDLVGPDHPGTVDQLHRENSVVLGRTRVRSGKPERRADRHGGAGQERTDHLCAVVDRNVEVGGGQERRHGRRLHNSAVSYLHAELHQLAGLGPAIAVVAALAEAVVVHSYRLHVEMRSRRSSDAHARLARNVVPGGHGDVERPLGIRCDAQVGHAVHARERPLVHVAILHDADERALDGSSVRNRDGQPALANGDRRAVRYIQRAGAGRPQREPGVTEKEQGELRPPVSILLPGDPRGGECSLGKCAGLSHVADVVGVQQIDPLPEV